MTERCDRPDELPDTSPTAPHAGPRELRAADLFPVTGPLPPAPPTAPARWGDIAHPPAVPFELAHAPERTLSPGESFALSAALACPDRFLVSAGGEAMPFIAELARLSLAAGERVLLLTAEAIDADKLVQRLRDLRPVRALGTGEVANQLPAASLERTPAALAEALAAPARERLRRHLDDLGHRQALLDAIRANGDVAAPAPPVLAARGHLTAEALTAETGTPFAESQTRADGEHRAGLAATEARIEQAQVERHAAAERLAHVIEQRTTLVAAVESKKAGGFFGAVKGLFHRDDSPERLPQLDAEAAQLQADLDHLDAALAAAKGERDALKSAHAEVQALELHAELTRRHAEFDRHDEAEARRHAEAVAGYGLHLARRAEAGLPADRPATAGDFARLADELARLPAAAEALQAEFPALAADAATHALAAARLVIGPAASAGSPAVRLARFDRAVLADADLLGERVWCQVWPLSAAWVVVGDAAAGGTPFQQLWRHSPVPAWRFESRRWVTALAAARPPGRVTSEPLADRPEVELRFINGQLVELAFPVGMPLCAAKAIAAVEAGESHVAPCGPPTWSESDDAVTAAWLWVQANADDWADLGQGVSEQVGRGEAPWTAAVRFAKPAGWTAETARDWLARHAPPRVAVLPAPAVRLAPPTPARQVAGARG